MRAVLLLPLSFLLLPLQEPKTLSLNYKNGESVNAQVIELKGEDVKLKMFVLGGSMQVTRKLAEFTPMSIYTIEMESKHPEGFDACFAMAKRAAELGLLPQAGAQGRAAIECVKDTAQAAAKRTEVRAWAADTLESKLKEAVGDGRLADAQHCLKLLSTRLADQRTEAQIDALDAIVDGLEAKDREKREATRQAKLDTKTRSEIDQKLKPIQKKVDDADKTLRDAISKSRNTSTSANLSEKAIDYYKSAWKALLALVEKFPDDAELARSAESMGKRIHDNGIRAALHAANVLTVQSDYKGAMDWANRVIAFDPENAEAKDMVRTIQIAEAAASNQWGWRWNVPGGPPPVVNPHN
jgi:tetratricopeptide (TPR) repeat protein